MQGRPNNAGPVRVREVFYVRVIDLFRGDRPKHLLNMSWREDYNKANHGAG